MSIMQMLLGASGASGYNIDRSVRFRASASAYLNRTFVAGGNQKTWTWSGWVKRGLFNSAGQVLFRSPNTDPSTGFRFSGTTVSDPSNDCIRLFFNNAASGDLVTTQVFRDPSAWYHLIISVDTTQATASDRAKIYVNGVQITSFSTASYPSQNYDTQINAATTHLIGAWGGQEYFDGYLAEVNFIDGQALTPASFGETNALTGVWQPAPYTGTYGTNGFYLKFTDNSTAAALGTDFSGNSNTWTVNNISLTAGVTYDSMTDVPTLTSATVANYAVLNPLSLAGSGTGSLTNANLTLTSPGTNGTGAQTAGSIAVTSSKYYFEGTFSTLTSASGYLCFGVQSGSVVISGLSGSTRAGTNAWWISDDGNYRANGGSITASGLGAFSAGNVAMIAIDASTGKGWIGKNGTWVGDPAAGTGNTFSSLPALIAPFAQAIRNTTTSSVLNANFGQRPFAYTPPTGFVALNTFNLPTSTIVDGSQYFDTSLYTGNGSTQSITGVGFSPDLVWIKARNAAYDHQLHDSIRGAGYALYSNLTTAEGNLGTVSSFDSDGFTVSVGSGPFLGTNGASTTFAGWAWKGSDSSAVTNTDGNVTSTVSVNASAGFSVVTYNQSSTFVSVGHGLGITPAMIIFKSRTNADNWVVWHKNLANTTTYALQLNTTTAQFSSTTLFNSTAPTSTVFTSGTGINTLASNVVAYCWSEIAGFSKFGSYTGNGSADGPFVYTGFRPSFVLIKNTSAVGNWEIQDASRTPSNVADKILQPNVSAAEATAARMDITSNGFKIRTTSSDLNASSNTYIYIAFAENPFKNSLAR